MPGGGARITLTQDGFATLDIAAHEMGMGTATAQSQVLAERLGLSLECVPVKYGDSSFAGPSWLVVLRKAPPLVPRSLRLTWIW
jgi:xanthine dehydrogenase YagR molybdenum-binding subunit